MSSPTRAATMAAMLLSTVFAMPVAANAQSLQSGFGDTAEIAPPDVGVMDRERPAYDAKGIPLGGFRLFPTLEESGNFDDNVFRTNAAQSDFFFVAAPSVRLRSEWGRHFFEVFGGMNNYNYIDFSDQDLTDWRLGSSGRLDVTRALNVKLNGYYGEMHELWSAPNNSVGFQAAPNRFFHAHAESIASFQPSRLGFEAGFAFDRYNWLDTPRIGGGVLTNDDRDQNEYQSYLKVNYDFSPGYSAFLKTSYDERDFDLMVDRSGLRRSSHGLHVDGGLTVQISHLLSGDIYLGYLQQNFPQNVVTPLKNVSGLDYGAELNWYVSQILTVHLTAKRTLDDVVLTNVSMASNKSVEVSADYEFRPNIIVQAHAGYANASYIGSTRTDDTPTAGVGINYLVNSYASLEFKYNYSDRATTNAALNYTDNTISVGLKLHI